VEIDPTGKIVIMTSANERAAPKDALDKWMTKYADQA
jgi:hypothetical protein